MRTLIEQVPGLSECFRLPVRRQPWAPAPGPGGGRAGLRSARLLRAARVLAAGPQRGGLLRAAARLLRGAQGHVLKGERCHRWSALQRCHASLHMHLGPGSPAEQPEVSHEAPERVHLERDGVLTAEAFHAHSVCASMADDLSVGACSELRHACCGLHECGC